MIQKISPQIKAELVVGIDIEETALKVAKKRNVMTVKCDLNVGGLPFRDNYFDLVLMSEVIEHIYNTDHILLESRRVLKPFGYLLVSTPNLAWWLNRLVLLLGYQPYFTNVSVKYDVGKLFRHPLKTGCKGQHIRMFTFKALRELLEFYSFRIIISRGVTSELLPSFIRKIDKAIGHFSCSLGADIVLLAQKL